MKEYFYIKDDVKLGPFSLKELISQDIELNSYVWFKGLDSWKRASEIAEIVKELDDAPPPIPVSNDKKLHVVVEQKRKPKSYQKSKSIFAREVIFILLIFAIAIGIFVIFLMGINSTRITRSELFYNGDWQDVYYYNFFGYELRDNQNFELSAGLGVFTFIGCLSIRYIVLISKWLYRNSSR